ncbi:hypothetical protein ATEIFO6365_0003070700 [Aspergillus terreus]|uniref:Fringe-like glycosyltransferase domain-containing protein n=1 Tax=Aspergillus terreus TaxID=33178 RepID=A0A5M3YUF9_ASPTE|nr:hypothetical protein ATETN484_0003065200 [Aspergillus terreus]GFF14641.1 hypothetical protein ATEIFO6365_0003070700 [Aspergillus terreus]
MYAKLGEKPRKMSSSWVWRKKLLRFLIAIILVSGFTVFLWPRLEYHHVTTETISNITITSDVECEPDFDLLRRLDIRKLNKHTRREMIAVPSSNDALPMRQQLNIPLFEQKPSSHRQGYLATGPSQDDCLIPHAVAVQVPKPPRNVDASHIDFGVATTLGRLNDSLDAFSHWAGYTRTRIFALIEPDHRLPEVQAKADSLGINLHVTESTEEYQRRYFSLISHLAQNMRPQTRWSCVIDDDTFFLSMSELVRALAAYDDTQPMYIGGLSESIPQIGAFGLMGFGGAGVFLSRPLLEQISQPEIFEACQNMDFTGDRRISLCVYQHTSTRLTINHRLHQLDIMGDVSGFFESGRQPPLSVHHWKSWFHMDMAKVSVVSELCGDDCLLRQWQFADGYILTNGISIIKYSSPVDPNDTTMELTWEGQNGAVHESYLHEMGPLRPKDWDKISYLLEDSVVEGNNVHQWYVHRDPERGDEIFEVIWRAG